MDDKQLIRSLREGDTAIEDYIMEKYKPMVLKKTRALFLLGGESEDLIQEGMIGLFKAVRDYDLEQQASFYTFADLCVSRQLDTAIKKSNRQKHMPLNFYVSLYERRKEEEGEKKLPLIEQLPPTQETNPEELFLHKENIEDLNRELKKRLSAFENKVLQFYLQGEDYHSIAQILEKTPKSIDNALQRIKQKVFDILSNVL